MTEAALARAVDPPEGSGVDLFLSYNSRDRGEVEAVRRGLEHCGVTTFLDRANLAPGLPWADALQAEIRRARAVLVFLGPAGLGVWQKREMVLALDRQA